LAEDATKSAGSFTEPPLLSGWRSMMFASGGDGQRRRRGSDGARLTGAILALVCCIIVIRYNSRIDRAIIQVIHPPPRSITWLVTVVYDAGAFGVTFVLLALALVARRGGIARGAPPVGDRARHCVECCRYGGGERDPHPFARKQRRKTKRNPDPRLLRALPGPPNRSLYGGRNGSVALSGARAATPHRVLHRLGGFGLSCRRSWAAGQRPRESGHRLGGDRIGPAHLWLTARPPLDR